MANLWKKTLIVAIASLCIIAICTVALVNESSEPEKGDGLMLYPEEGMDYSNIGDTWWVWLLVAVMLVALSAVIIVDGTKEPDDESKKENERKKV
jgi:hypothetical protein